MTQPTKTLQERMAEFEQKYVDLCNEHGVIHSARVRPAQQVPVMSGGGQIGVNIPISVEITLEPIPNWQPKPAETKKEARAKNGAT